VAGTCEYGNELSGYVAEGYVFGLRAAAPNHTGNLKTKAPSTSGSNLLYNTLEPLMMDIVVPETC